MVRKVKLFCGNVNGGTCRYLVLPRLKILVVSLVVRKYGFRNQVYLKSVSDQDVILADNMLGCSSSTRQKLYTKAQREGNASVIVDLQVC